MTTTSKPLDPILFELPVGSVSTLQAIDAAKMLLAFASVGQKVQISIKASTIGIICTVEKTANGIFAETWRTEQMFSQLAKLVRITS